MTLLNEMPPEAKVWIYAANRPLTDSEAAAITEQGHSFTQSWTAHQKQLKASFSILHNIFIVIMVDEQYNEVSGCGIDKSVQLIRDIDKMYQLDLFNRLRLELWQNNKVVIANKQELSAMLQAGTVNEQTLVFNKTITTQKQFDTLFQIPLSQSWVFPSLLVANAK